MARKSRWKNQMANLNYWHQGKNRKRSILVNLLLVWCLVFALVPIAPIEAEAADAPNWYCGAYTSPVNPFAKNNLYGQCTWYAWGRAYEMTGKQLPCRGDAGTWYAVAQQNEWAVGSEPRANSIAVWEGTEKYPTGHVAYVESVSDSVIISDANYRVASAPYPCTDLEVGKQYYEGLSPLNSYRPGRLLGYIYLGDQGSKGSPMQSGGSRIIPDGDYQIVAGIDSNQYLTVEGYSTENHANVQLWSDASHIFHVKWLGENEGYQITYKNSGLSLTVDGSDKQWSGLNVVQWEWYNNIGQKWVINDTGDGQYFSIQARSSGFYLDIVDGKNENGTNVRMFVGNSSNAQKWKFIPCNPILPAGRRTISDGDYHIVSALENDQFNPGSRCLTIGGIPGAENQPGANAELWNVFGDPDHVFTVTWLGESYNGNGYYSLKLKNSDTQALAVDLSRNMGLKRGTNVQQQNDSSDDSQQWVIEAAADGSGCTIRSKYNGWYIDVRDGTTADGTNIQVWERNGSNAQKWLFIPWAGGNSAKQELPDGEYQIVSKMNPDMALHVKENGTTDGRNVDLWSCAGDKRHTFNIRWLGDGYYEIVNKDSGLALDVEGGSCVSGANVQLYRPWDSCNQKWIIRSCGNGYFTIISKCSGLYLDITDAKAENGANIQMCVGWEKTGVDCQQWKFIPWDPTPQIQIPPSASEITYGQTLADSTLTGGAANTPGSFTWKDSTIRPTCSDSSQTKYTVVFTPSDIDNWKPTETEVTVKVNPALNAPDMPNSVMTVTYGRRTVGDVALPTGWQWRQADKDTVLKAGSPVTAQAVYMGNDKGNYVNEHVSVSITMTDCNHSNNIQEIKGSLDASCETEGYTGDIYCAECGTLIEHGCSIAPLGHDYYMETIKEPTKYEAGERLYTCDRCGDTYTEPIPIGTVYQITLEATEGGHVTGSGVYAEGESATVKAIPDSGYRFVKWVEYVEKDTRIVTERTIAPISFDSLAESEDDADVTTATPSNAQRTSAAKEEKTVSTFTKHYALKLASQTAAATATETIVSSNESYTFTVTGNRTLKAIFEKTETPSSKEYTVIFQANDGSGSQDSTITQNGRLSSLPVPTRTGYSFKGWFMAKSGGSQVTLNTVFTKDTIIYAHWDKINSGTEDNDNKENNNSGGSGSSNSGSDSSGSGGSDSSNSGSGNSGSSGGSGSSSGDNGSSNSGGDSSSGSGNSSGSGSNSNGSSNGGDSSDSGGSSSGGGSSNSSGGSGNSSGGDSSNGGGNSNGSSGSSNGGSSSSSGGGGSSKGSNSKNGMPGIAPSPSDGSLPSYVITGSWIPVNNDHWQFRDSAGQLYKSQWAAVSNPYANTAAGQSAFDWFYFDEAGNMVTGWFKYTDGNSYYLNPASDGTQGRMMTGWTWIADETGISRCYYLNPVSDGFRGKMMTNTVVDGYTINAEGCWIVNGVIQTK